MKNDFINLDNFYLNKSKSHFINHANGVIIFSIPVVGGGVPPVTGGLSLGGLFLILLANGAVILYPKL